MWTIDGEVFGSAVGAAVILPDGSKSFGTGFMAARDRRRARRRLGGGATARGDGRAGHLRADRLPQRRGLRRPAVRRRRRPDAEVALRHDLQRRDGRDPGGVRRSHVPDGDPARGGTSTPRSPRWRGSTRSACAASTPTPTRRTRGTRTSPTGTGIRSGRRAPTSRMPVNFHIGASATSMSWLGSDALALVRRRAQARARLARRDDLQLPHHREPAAVGRARAAPDAARRVGGERARAGSRSCSKASTTRSASARPTSASTCRCSRRSTSGARCTRATGSSATTCRARSTRWGATTSSSRPTSRTRRASTPTAWHRAAEPLRAIEPGGAAQDPQHQRGHAVPDPGAGRMRDRHRPARLTATSPPSFLTEVLRDAGLIGDATVVDAPAETVGAGLMGICARYHLRLDRDVPGAPRQRGRQVRGAGRDRTRVHGVERLPQRALLLPALRVEGLDQRAPLRTRRHRRRRVVHAHPRGLRADGAGRPAPRLHRRPGRGRGPRARRVARAAVGLRGARDPRLLRRSGQRRARARWSSGCRRSSPASSTATAPRSRPTRWGSTSGSAGRPGTGSRPVPPDARSCTATTGPTTSSSPRGSGRRSRSSTGRASRAARP